MNGVISIVSGPVNSVTIAKFGTSIVWMKRSRQRDTGHFDRLGNAAVGPERAFGNSDV